MGFKVSVKWVKEICEKRVESRGLTWEEAVALKCDAVFEMHKMIMLKKWKKTNTK
jgi:hypothetical protein